MSLPPTTYAIIGAATILPSLCLGLGAAHIGNSLAEKVTGKDAAFVRPLEAVLSGITTYGGCKVSGNAALRRFTHLTPMVEPIFSVVKPHVSQTIFAGALIAGVYVFRVVGAMAFPESTATGISRSLKD
ncbi:hypothetical protein SPRG_17565 [Saprolegnia parasitica CBS 223.65]|uniref:Uncharacterized protein n=1 Tax=Saprolegnia parasitica (strain CBS 223.65) TaxID=695850 RepID=A0A067BQN1_SAPPC|nr:hypothetical protein SPRG_17565 [Saprolegnia parasitica CBS 223.65]KDO16992.1 hypothetical protein SPRG_17565 [Saprolegnia parasitica CBS 223.65]|eukprot:XP_012212300.1 hypothetical protein SPRG_17565 [Saprolegnia parasitica CBS 223.65]